MQEHFMDMDGVQELLRMARTGLWTIELEEGREPRMYGDKAMLELLGLEGMPSPEECYREWYDRIDHDFYPMIETGVDEMIRNKRAEVQYPWEHPLWGPSVCAFEASGMNAMKMGYASGDITRTLPIPSCFGKRPGSGTMCFPTCASVIIPSICLTWTMTWRKQSGRRIT